MLGTLICDDCAQILEAFNLIQFFTVDSDVHADTICVVGHQFGLLCTNLPKAAEVLPRRSTGEPSSSWACQAINVISKTMRRSSLIISSSHITFSIITLFN